MPENRSASALPRRLPRLIAGLVLAALLPLPQAAAHDDMSAMPEHDHAHHPAVAANKVVNRSEASYTIPTVTLVRRDGARVAFPQALDGGRPVLLNFVYTSCTTVCPLSSQVFSRVQEILGKEPAPVTMVSISIDPEFDTPARLRAYARRFNAGSSWQHYTGTVAASLALQKAFDVYRGDKMEHSPVTFLRAAPGKPWVRLDGFVSPEEIVDEYHRLTRGS